MTDRVVSGLNLNTQVSRVPLGVSVGVVLLEVRSVCSLGVRIGADSGLGKQVDDETDGELEVPSRE